MKIAVIIYYFILILFILSYFFVLFFPSTGFSLFLFGFFGLICHQGDFLTIGGNIIALPLCFRCTGIYLFMIAGSLTAEKFGKRIKPGMFSILLVIGVLPLILDGFLKFSQFPGFGMISFLTGALFGFTCGSAVIYGINGIMKTVDS